MAIVTVGARGKGMRAGWVVVVGVVMLGCGGGARKEQPPVASEPEQVAPPSTQTPETDSPGEEAVCGRVFACRRMVLRDGQCALEPLAAGTRCTVSDALPGGSCDGGGACILASPPYAAWGWRPGIHLWELAGQAPGGGLLLAGMTSPRDAGFQGPHSECRLTRFDPERPDREQPLHEGVAPCHPWVLHGRHAVGQRWVPERAQRMWSVLTLEGGEGPRDFDLDRLLSERLAAEGVTPAVEKPLWVQGAPGQLVLVWPLTSGGVWVGSLSLERLEWGWTRQLSGKLQGKPLADESGQLYLALRSPGESQPRVVSLSTQGEVRWTWDGAGAPVAVFRDTLFLDDGTVRTPSNGHLRYRWQAAGVEYVLLSETHAAVVSGCEGVRACTRVRLLNRGTGARLSEASVPGPAPWLEAQKSAAAHLTADGAVLLIQPLYYPDLMTSPYHPIGSVRRYVVREGQPPRLQGELLVTGLERGLLHEGQWVAVQRDSRNNDDMPGAILTGIPAAGLRAPEHGWLTPWGNLAGGSAPE
ncbi:hypothetical protein NR798_11430 [Archangium gephyra]|uniref:hypothetical protein n=1 Tax=Archangium gephyra TaxID=48 RepID=UPI0035D4D9E3